MENNNSNKSFSEGFLNKLLESAIEYYNVETNNEPIKNKFSDKNQELKHEYFLHSDNNNKKIEEAKKFNNSFFEETINIKGIYNRCVMFDASLFHAAHVFTGKPEEKERLILVNAIFSISDRGKILKYPVAECRRC